MINNLMCSNVRGWKKVFFFLGNGTVNSETNKFCKLILFTKRNNDQFWQPFSQLQSIIFFLFTRNLLCNILFLFNENFIEMEYFFSLNKAKFDISFIFIMTLCMSFPKICYIAPAETFHYHHTHFLMYTFCLHLTNRKFLL